MKIDQMPDGSEVMIPNDTRVWKKVKRFYNNCLIEIRTSDGEWIAGQWIPRDTEVMTTPAKEMSDKVTPLKKLLNWVEGNQEYQGSFECGSDYQEGFSYIDPEKLLTKILALIPAEREFASDLFYANRECGDFNSFYSQFNQELK